VGDDIALTTSKDVLEAVARGAGPGRMLVTLGYAGWGAGQLENEIAHNAWLTVQAQPGVIFDTPVEQRFHAALSLLGIRSTQLMGQAGHA
jgi:putative transcriptional regulator